LKSIITIAVSDCEDATYNVTIDVIYMTSTLNENSFELYDLYSGTVIGEYLLSDLPITIEDFPVAYTGLESDFLIATLFNSSSHEYGCCAGLEYNVPNCE
jgi:hypothetical protein